VLQQSANRKTQSSHEVYSWLFLFQGEITVPSQHKGWQRDVARRARRSRKHLKSNRKPKKARRKDWVAYSSDNLDDFYDLDYPQSERIMPRGERERRRVVEAATLAALERGGNSRPQAPARKAPGQQGVVVQVSTSLCRVSLNGRSLLCAIRGTLSAEGSGYSNVVAVGDRVIVSVNGKQGVVEHILPRQGILARANTYNAGHRVRDRHSQQLIAANVDHLLIVASWRAPTLWPELVDRYLIAAQRNELTATLCVNKIDLAESLAACRAELQPYLDLGYRVLFTSALTGQGVEELISLLRGRTTVLAGMSGTGKSSLLTAIQPNLQLKAKAVSEHSGEGRHTTTQVSMKELDMGGFVIDTPGIREFGLSGLQAADLARFYPEIAAAAANCRFGNCTHMHEPGCAVPAAVEQGSVSETRYHNYKCICNGLQS
jgi:ribosome biogenesis GTPase